MGLVVTGTAGGSAAWTKITKGLHGAVIGQAESVGQSTFNPNRERIRIPFIIDGEQDDDGQPVSLFMYLNLVLTPKSSLNKLLSELGIPWTPGQPFALDSLTGRRCQVLVTIADGPNGPTPQIENVIGTGTQPQAVASAQPADVCCIPSCTDAVFQFDGDGNPFCQKHLPR